GIDREDLQTLWKLVKTKHGDTRPEDEHERVLWGDLKVITAGTKVNAAGLQLLEDLLLVIHKKKIKAMLTVDAQGGAKGGKITGKGILKTSKLDFEDVLLKVPRKNNMYNVDMKNIFPKESLTCLAAKAALDESMLWHRRLSHVKFKTINKLVKENLVRGLPLKHFENDQTCVAYLKGKQHKASCKSKIQNSITQPLFMLYMDLFGPTFMSSLMNKKYCLVVTDDYNRFTWVFFLASKDETSGILKSFITEIENIVDKKVKIIRCDNGTEFKNRVMSDFCEKKGNKREFSVARTPQQNGVAERRNRTLIEAARTMLANSKLLPSNFRLKQFYYLLVLIVLGYAHIRTRKVEENLHIRFLEDKPIIAGDEPNWLFDIDVLTKSMNYVPVVAGTNSNDFVGTKESIGAGHSSKETGYSQDILDSHCRNDGSLF
ncbi:putative ribonuclease H-like domain-containing protein, partial [Tanacetum coccineum]